MGSLLTSLRIRFNSALHRLTATTPEALLLILTLAASLAFFAAFLWVALSRLSWPYDLEWMEGGMLTHSRQLLEGRPLFAAPSADFIAYIYQPLYAIVVAMAGALFGLTPATARAISLLSTIVLALFLVRTAQRETGDLRIAVITGGLFFALYPITGYWFDLARVDMLFLMLLMSGLYVARYHAARRGSWLWSSLSLTAAFFTKQTAVLFFPLAVPLLYRERKRSAIAFIVTSIILVGSLTWLADLGTDHWYTYYTHHLVSGEPYIIDRLRRDFWLQVARDLPLLFPALLVFGVWRSAGTPLATLAGETWLLAALLGMVNALLTWSRPGGFINNFLPFYTFALLPVAEGLKAALRAPQRPLPLAALLLVFLQLLLLAYDPRPQVPGPEDRDAGGRVIDLLARTPGKVLIPEHPWYAVLAGHEPSYQTMGLVDLRFKEGPIWPDDLRDRLRNQAYAAVITAWEAQLPTLGSYPPELWTYYRKTEALELPGTALESKTGTWARPTFVYRPILASWRQLRLTTGFEEGHYQGWLRSGNAFGDAPARGTFPGQLPVDGYGGQRLANSFFRSQDAPTGSLVTPWFRLDATRIRFRVGGGMDNGRLGVQLWSDGGLQRKAAGRNTEMLEEVVWDVSDLRGQVVQLRVIDQSSLPWGHVLFDDLAFEQ